MSTEKPSFADITDRSMEVNVHLTDGTVFSGVIYSASTDTAGGIMLMNARLIEKGNSWGSSGISFQPEQFLQIAAHEIVKIIETDAGCSLKSRTIGDDSSEREHDGSSQCVLKNPMESSVVKVNPVDERQTSEASTSIRSDANFSATTQGNVPGGEAFVRLYPPEENRPRFPMNSRFHQPVSAAIPQMHAPRAEQAGVPYYPVPYYATPLVMPQTPMQYPYEPRAGQMVTYGNVPGGGGIPPLRPPLRPPYHQGNHPWHWFPRNSRFSGKKTYQKGQVMPRIRHLAWTMLLSGKKLHWSC